VAQALAPDLRAHIEVLEVATPVTYQRYTGNRDGSIMGAKPTKRNIKAKLAHHQTPVARLLLAGHWAEYGGGLAVAMKSAANASLLILEQSRKAKRCARDERSRKAKRCARDEQSRPEEQSRPDEQSRQDGESGKHKQSRKHAYRELRDVLDRA
jgi:hypothetical protein